MRGKSNNLKAKLLFHVMLYDVELQMCRKLAVNISDYIVNCKLCCSLLEKYLFYFSEENMSVRIRK